MTNEKRCDNCGWEFYNVDFDYFENEKGIEELKECCPECGSIDFEYKLIGKG